LSVICILLLKIHLWINWLWGRRHCESVCQLNSEHCSNGTVSCFCLKCSFIKLHTNLYGIEL